MVKHRSENHKGSQWPSLLRSFKKLSSLVIGSPKFPLCLGFPLFQLRSPQLSSKAWRFLATCHFVLHHIFNAHYHGGIHNHKNPEMSSKADILSIYASSRKYLPMPVLSHQPDDYAFKFLSGSTPTNNCTYQLPAAEQNAMKEQKRSTRVTFIPLHNVYQLALFIYLFSKREDSGLALSTKN